MKIIPLLLTFALSATAADYHLEVTPDATQINWTLPDVLHSVHGTFKLKAGDLHFDPETGKASGEIVVDATSGESGNSTRDGRMHKNILESSKYPQISFAPDRLEGPLDLAATSHIKLHGIFKIHGAAHEITVPVEVTAKEDRLDARLKFDVPYVAWGMKDPSTFVLRCGKIVAIEIQTTGHISK